MRITSLYASVTAAVALVLATGLFVLGGPSASQAAELRMSFWSGAEGEAIVKHCVDPWQEKTGHTVVWEPGYTSMNVAKVKAQAANPELDIVFMGDIGTYNLAREGLLEILDFSRIPTAANINEEFRSIADGAGLGWALWVTTVVYNTDVVEDPPTSWNDLWDPKYKDHVVLPAAGWTDALNVVLMANYLVDADPRVDASPGFEKLAELKDNVLLLGENPAQVAQLFQTGDIHIGVYPIGVFQSYVQQGYPIGMQTVELQEGFFAEPLVLSVVKGHPGDIDVIHDFLDFSVGIQCQKGIAKDIWYSPVNTKVEATPELLAQPGIVMGPEKLAKIIPVNYEEVAANQAAWTEELTRALIGD
jgi:putative spermidine/putrescine transport system substrate-binding protein